MARKRQRLVIRRQQPGFTVLEQVLFFQTFADFDFSAKILHIMEAHMFKHRFIQQINPSNSLKEMGVFKPPGKGSNCKPIPILPSSKLLMFLVLVERKA